MRLHLIYLSLVALFLSQSSAQQTSWQWVNPLPQGNTLNGISTRSSDTAVVVGAMGTILRTVNGGQTWQVFPTVNGLSTQLSATQFISSSMGFALGEDAALLKTIDGGISWHRISLNSSASLNAIKFVTPDTGWLVGTGGTALRTGDGGQTWTPLRGINFGMTDSIFKDRKSVV